MTPSGILMMALSVTLVLGLAIFCFYRILTEKPHEHHAPLDIDTHDTEVS